LGNYDLQIIISFVLNEGNDKISLNQYLSISVTNKTNLFKKNGEIEGKKIRKL
jgi:hypothetical protein